MCNHCARPLHTCSSCGRVDQIKAVIDGEDLCQRCYAPPVRPCGRCGRERRIATRYQDGVADICRSCYRTGITVCAICAEEQPVRTTGWPIGPVCDSCYRRTLRHPGECPVCGQLRALIGRSGDGERVCGPCAGSHRDYLCTVCGEPGDQHYEQTCLPCSIIRAARELLATHTGTIPEHLAGLPEALAQRGRAASTMRWLSKPRPKALLETIGAERVISHARVDACPPGQARHHLRALLVDAGVLPVRDEQTERLETWVDEFLAGLPAHHAGVIAPYAHWKVLRTVRRRGRRRRTSIGVAGFARERVRAAARLLRHLDQDGGSIDSLTQEALDRWVDGNATRHGTIAPFIRWINHRRDRPGLRIESAKTAHPAQVNDEEQQRALIKKLATGEDDHLDLPTRAAGLLVLLYGARIERIHRLTTADIITTGERTYLALSPAPIELPLVVARLLEQLARDAVQTPSSRIRAGGAYYLFGSGRRHHEPIHPETLRRWIAQAGISSTVTRNYAMLTLATDLPAAVVAAQLGLTAQTTTRWAQQSQRDNTEFIIARSEE